MPQPPLRAAEISALIDAAITANLQPSTLLGGIDVGLLATLPVEPSRAAQILSDLHRLNALSALGDDAIPLRTWLNNAILLAGPRPEREAFEITLRVLDQRLTGAPAGPAGTPRRAQATQCAVRAFISATWKEARYIEALEKHLSPLVHVGQLDLWHRGRGRAGDDVQQEAEKRLDRAEIVLLMVSADYLADQETSAEAARTPELLARGARVVPVIARPCEWRSLRFGSLVPLPRSGRPISSRGHADSAYAEIAREISSIIRELHVRSAPSRDRGSGAATRDRPRAVLG